MPGEGVGQGHEQHPPRSQGTFENLKAAAVGIHGVGETLRGTLNNSVDQRLRLSRDHEKQAQIDAKNRAVMERGRGELDGLQQTRSGGARPNANAPVNGNMNAPTAGSNDYGNTHPAMRNNGSRPQGSLADSLYNGGRNQAPTTQTAGYEASAWGPSGGGAAMHSQAQRPTGYGGYEAKPDASATHTDETEGSKGRSGGLGKLFKRKPVS